MRTVAATAAAVLVVSGCTGGSTPLDRIVDAPGRVRSAGSASLTMEVTSTVATEGRDPVTSGSAGRGVIDFGSERGEMTLELQLPEEVAARLNPVPCTFLFDGSTAYMRIAESLIGNYDGKRWLRADASELAGFDVQGFGATDPTGSLEMLRGTTEELEAVGTEEVGGTQTTHYRGEVSGEKILDQVEGDRRAQFEEFLQRLDVDRFPVDVWIDDGGLPRRTTFTLDAGGAAQVRVEMTLELGDFGDPVEVEVPAETTVLTPEDPQAAASVCFGITPVTGPGT